MILWQRFIMEIVSTIDFAEQYVFASALKPVGVPSSRTRLSRIRSSRTRSKIYVDVISTSWMIETPFPYLI